jgi:translation initiation factor IF-1
MPKSNQFGGNKTRKNAKQKDFQPTKSTNFPLPSENRFICKTIKLNGNNVNVIDQDNKPLCARIPGSFLKRVWIKIDDYLLIEVVDELATNKYHVIYKYSPDEVKGLIKEPEKGNFDNIDDNFDFEDI